MATHDRLSATSFGISVTTRGSGGFSARLRYGKAELVGEGLGDLPFGGEIEADEHRAQAFACAFVLGQRRLEIVLSDEARLNQALTELFAHRSSADSRCKCKLCEQLIIGTVVALSKLVRRAKSVQDLQICANSRLITP